MPSALDSILHRRGSATTGERYLRSRRIFSVAIMNNTVYQTTADGICTPFVTFDRMVWGIAFTPDGSRMLATLRGAVPIFSDGWNSGPGVDRGAIVFGASRWVYRSRAHCVDVEVAPANFGEYAGQIFFTDWEEESPVPPAMPLKPESTLNRIAPDGTVLLVASGFLRPAGVSFIDGSIWVSNLNRDVPELPEGSIVRIDIR